jgi:molybdate transport system regulatory protein
MAVPDSVISHGISRLPLAGQAGGAQIDAMANLFLRLPVGGGMIGPGKAELMEWIARTGSIRAAAAAMKLSYRRAWLLVQETEDLFGAPVLERHTGGKRGGGAALTPLGRAIVKHYRAAEGRAARAIRADVAALKKLRKS